MRMGRSAQRIRIRPLTLSGTSLVQRVIESAISTQLLRGASPDYGRLGAVNPPDQPHGITTHQSGQRTLLGVRVAFSTISCSLEVSCFSPKRAKAASTIQGSSSTQEIVGYRNPPIASRFRKGQSGRTSRSQPAPSAILLSAIRNARLWVSLSPGM